VRLRTPRVIHVEAVHDGAISEYRSRVVIRIAYRTVVRRRGELTGGMRTVNWLKGVHGLGIPEQ